MKTITLTLRVPTFSKPKMPRISARGCAVALAASGLDAIAFIASAPQEIAEAAERTACRMRRNEEARKQEK